MGIFGNVSNGKNVNNLVETGLAWEKREVGSEVSFGKNHFTALALVPCFLPSTYLLSSLLVVSWIFIESPLLPGDAPHPGDTKTQETLLVFQMLVVCLKNQEGDSPILALPGLSTLSFQIWTFIQPHSGGKSVLHPSYLLLEDTEDASLPLPSVFSLVKNKSTHDWNNIWNIPQL